MKRMDKFSFLFSALFMLAATLPRSAVLAETLVGSTIESRVLLGFKVDDAAAQARLPEGWTLVTLPKGPTAGANLLIALIDRHLIRNPDGKPGTPASGPTAAFVSFGKKEGEKGVRMFVTRVFETAPLVNPYGTSIAARFQHKATTEGSEENRNTRSESWVINPEGGGTIALDLAYEVGTPSWSEGNEARPYSAANPDFHRIYRYDQLAELAMSKGLGKPLSGEVNFEANVADLASLFDGKEELVAIVAIPVYVREIYLP